MKIRFAAALFALALPLCAQEPTAAETLFYKAYWLQNGERNFAEAMTLYEKFLQQAPDHALVGRAAQFQFELLTRAGKTDEAKTFAAKYEKVLGKVTVPAAGEARGEGRGRGGEGGDTQARLADLKKQLEEAKAAGEQEQVQRLERQIRRLEQAGTATGAPGGASGRAQRGAGGLFGGKKLTEMSTEEVDQFKQGLERMAGMVERMREANPDGAKAMEENLATLQKALDENKLEDAQKALDKIRESMPRGGRRGGGEGGGGRGEGGGRPAGGGGGGGGN